MLCDDDVLLAWLTGPLAHRPSGSVTVPPTQPRTIPAGMMVMVTTQSVSMLYDEGGVNGNVVVVDDDDATEQDTEH